MCVDFQWSMKDYNTLILKNITGIIKATIINLLYFDYTNLDTKFITKLPLTGRDLPENRQSQFI